MRAILVAITLGLQSVAWAQSSARAEFSDFTITLTDLAPADATPATFVMNPDSAYAQYHVYGGSFENSHVLETAEFMPTASLSAGPSEVTATSSSLKATTTALSNRFTYATLFTYANFALSPHSSVSLSGTFAALAHCDACEFANADASIYVAANGAQVSRVFFSGDEDGNTDPYTFTYANPSAAPVEVRIALTADAWVSMAPPVPELPAWLLACVAAAVLIPKAQRRSKTLGTPPSIR